MPPNDDARPIVANGIMAETSDYALPPLSLTDIAALAEEVPFLPQLSHELRGRRGGLKSHRVVRLGVNPRILSEAGWGVVFAADDPQAAIKRQALLPLLSRRRAQAGALYREFIDAHGLRPDESGDDFLARHGAGPGPVDPAVVPYYLLIVGGPETIPFAAQSAMDVRHAVGRLAFDTPAALESYARDLAAREAGAPKAQRGFAMFATANVGDEATQRSADGLASPVAAKAAAALPGWSHRSRIGNHATKSALAEIINESPPSILFTATHGALMAPGHSDQRAIQGALVTQEWRPTNTRRPLAPTERFAAGDVDDSASLDGMVALLFACFSGGTPQFDDFVRFDAAGDTQLAPRPFVAQLIQRMLRAGAGAVIGHVDRAWTASFEWPYAGTITTPYEDIVLSLAKGDPVGLAVESLNRRYAEIAVILTEALRKKRRGEKNDKQIASLWLAMTDARNYIVHGDPAARLSLT